MKKYFSLINIIPLLVILYAFIIFLPGFSLFFHQDDFIHLAVSQHLSQIINAFNLFSQGEFAFYRPLPTQVYYYLGKLVFGLNPFGYHSINFLIFSANIILVFILGIQLIGKKIIGALASVFYGINSTHVAPLFAAAYVHELLYTFFGLVCILAYIKKRYLLSLIVFILALMTKENALALPGILALYEIIFKKNSIPKTIRIIIPYALILSIYLFGHFFFYGIAQSSSYQVIIGKPTLNILIWYFLWALSTPNILIDFLGSKFVLNPVFFAVSGFHGYTYLISFSLFLLFLLVFSFIFFKTDNLLKRYILFASLWFIVGLIPLLPFPLHKLGTEQAFSLVGLSLGLATILSFIWQKKWGRPFVGLSLFFFLLISTNSIILARKTHWIVKSSREGEKVINYFRQRYNQIPKDSIIYFENGEIVIPEYGSSKQLYYSLGGGEALRIFLEKPELQIYFEDINPPPKNTDPNKIIPIDSSQFIN